ncbi:MAG: hypothetical protein RLO50_18765 [Azospirillaceae bacterium]
MERLIGLADQGDWCLGGIIARLAGRARGHGWCRIGGRWFGGLGLRRPGFRRVGDLVVGRDSKPEGVIADLGQRQ